MCHIYFEPVVKRLKYVAYKERVKFVLRILLENNMIMKKTHETRQFGEQHCPLEEVLHNRHTNAKDAWRYEG